MLAYPGPCPHDTEIFHSSLREVRESRLPPEEDVSSIDRVTVFGLVYERKVRTNRPVSVERGGQTG